MSDVISFSTLTHFLQTLVEKRGARVHQVQEKEPHLCLRQGGRGTYLLFRLWQAATHWRRHKFETHCGKFVGTAAGSMFYEEHTAMPPSPLTSFPPPPPHPPSSPKFNKHQRRPSHPQVYPQSQPAHPTQPLTFFEPLQSFQQTPLLPPSTSFSEFKNQSNQSAILCFFPIQNQPKITLSPVLLTIDIKIHSLPQSNRQTPSKYTKTSDAYLCWFSIPDFLV